MAIAKPREVELFDLTSIIKTWAIETFILTRTKEQKKLKLDDLTVKIIWDDITAWNECPRFSDNQTLPLPKAHALFATKFCNNTESEQEYNFRTERSTRSVAEIEITKGYTASKDFAIKLQLPQQILEASAGFKHELSLTQASHQTVEEELSWGIDTRVVVPPKCVAEANIRILEEKMTCQFSVESRMHGRVRALILDPKNSNISLKHMESDLAEIVGEHLARPKPVQKSCQTNVSVEQFSGTRRMLVLKTEGRCSFRFGVKQDVVVNQIPAIH